MQTNYLNRDAELLLANMPESQSAWARFVIAELKTRHPMADHWTTGGESFNYTDIRIGKKGKNNKKGLPVFYIREPNGTRPVSLLVNIAARTDEDAYELVYDPAHGQQQIQEWLDAYALSDSGHARLEGSGLSPADYMSPAEGTDEGDAEADASAPASPEARQPAQALNRILYGPPGTGKTYRTMAEALSIIERTDAPEGDYDAQKKRFDALCREGRIAFVTFHQSFSYEDFIEGIRAETLDGKISYRVKDGIFKKMAITAMYRPHAETSQDGEPDFDDVYDAFLAQVRAALPYKLTGARGGEMEIRTISARDTLYLTHPGRFVPQGVSRARMKSLYQAYPDAASLDGRNVNQSITEVIRGANVTAYWAALKALLAFKDQLPEEMTAVDEVSLSPSDELDYEQIKRRALGAETLTPNGLPYVLIIDEINRGNMSRIFGELITLIEASKRAGRRESAEVQLPYSNERFSVPANLYLIGTMNTADRSLAVVDTALRRRFDFVEMMPAPEKLHTRTIGEGADKIDLVQMLNAINLRIEHLYDREHMIGHSFFMGLTDDSTIVDLALIFKNNILPLLEEYFFEDWEKIRKILGKADIHTSHSSAKLGFTHQGKVYRRDLDKLERAATYQAIYRDVETGTAGHAEMVDAEAVDANG